MTLPVKTGIFVFIFTAGLPLGFEVTERMKRLDGFCVSCHLDEQTPLHDAKQKAFIRGAPVNLAGAHRKKSIRKFHCGDCHTGHNLPLKLKITYLETYNTFKHILGMAKEPKHLDDKLMPDDNCRACHSGFAAAPDRFHGLEQHRPSVPVQCIKCHSSHATGLENYNFIVMERMIEACRKCHPRFSPIFKRILKPA
ncbi:MAG: hypothetical protein IEMM0002_1268 [bacterium]|nr:MAG: hypothetical protein IEMM0002_1268 [bacterium]